MIDQVAKFNAYMTQHTDRVPLLSVKSTEDKRFIVLRDFLSSIYVDVEDNAYSVGQHLSKFVDSLSTMEPNDKARVTNTVRKYEVKGESGGVSGERTYGYDKSRLDRKMYRRKRPN
tara:strand:- start:430 stop:777 length:348 start_codon:yes stop_codon:yes gene_type:complete